MPRMSKAMQKELGFTDQQADFDEFLQEPNTPRARSLQQQHGYKRVKSKKSRLSIKSLLSGEYGAEQEQKRLKPPNNVTGPRG